jgi:hypothetical protein
VLLHGNLNIYNHDEPNTEFSVFWGCLLEMLSPVLYNYLNFFKKKKTASFRALKINRDRTTVSPFNFKNCNKSLVFRTKPGGGKPGGGGFVGLGFFFSDCFENHGYLYIYI